MKKHGFESHPKKITSVLASIYVSSTKGELKTPQEFWSVVLRKLKISAQPLLTRELEAVRNSHISEVWKLYDGVLSVISGLQKKYRLALVSNCSPGTDKLIGSLGLANFFNCTILSYQVGARKPDRDMYCEALRCLELEARECIFVADEISDLEGARALGLSTMLVRQGLNTFNEAKNLKFKPDFQISQISEITKFL